jgi:hypothetical protein
MVQIGSPTATTCPSLAMCSPMLPSAGDGISALTLSVTTSAIDSYLETSSPGCFIQRAMVPSVTLSPSWGMVTVMAMVCVLQYAASVRTAASSLSGVTR